MMKKIIGTDVRISFCEYSPEFAKLLYAVTRMLEGSEVKIPKKERRAALKAFKGA